MGTINKEIRFIDFEIARKYTTQKAFKINLFHLRNIATGKSGHSLRQQKITRILLKTHNINRY